MYRERFRVPLKGTGWKNYFQEDKVGLVLHVISIFLEIFKRRHLCLTRMSAKKAGKIGWLVACSEYAEKYPLEAGRDLVLYWASFLERNTHYILIGCAKDSSGRVFSDGFYVLPVQAGKDLEGVALNVVVRDKDKLWESLGKF